MNEQKQVTVNVGRGTLHGGRVTGWVAICSQHGQCSAVYKAKRHAATAAALHRTEEH